MLTFKHYAAPSSIHGTGLFTSVDLNKDDVLWVYQPRFDLSWTQNTYNLLPLIAQQYIRDYGWLDKDDTSWHLSVDGDKYTNHSETPNTYLDESGCMRAKVRIPKGTEITANYNDFDLDIEYKLTHT